MKAREGKEGSWRGERSVGAGGERQYEVNEE